jgi:glycosyltransferase 2 family protein
VMYWVWCFGFDMPTSFWFGVSCTVFLALAVAAPSAPGFAGVYELGCIAAFRLFGLDAAIATSYAIVSHVYQYVFIIVYGVWVLMKYGLRVGELRNKW